MSRGWNRNGELTEMDNNLWSICVTGIISLLSIIVLYRTWRKTRFRSKNTAPLPLGTLGWPFVGETIEFISSAYSCYPESFMNKRRLQQVVPTMFDFLYLSVNTDRIWNLCRYGKVFKSHIFGSPTIVSIDAEVSKFILQSDARTFVPSYPSSLTELMGKSSILLINGSLQRRVHGLIGAFLKSPNLKAQITADMEKYLLESMNSWKDDELIYVQDVAKNIAFHVLVKALISLEPGEEMQFLKQQFEEFIAGLMSFPINLPGTQLYRSLRAKKRMVKLVHRIIQDKRKNCSPSPPKDVVDVLLNDSSRKLTVDLISDNMIDLMIPGEDSVPVLMTLATKYISDCPRALLQLMEENMSLKRTKSQLGEPLQWTDYMSLSFTQDVITETLRMGNIITGVMRKAMKDVEIKGHRIPKGWCTLTYFRSVHMDESSYDWPYQFNPWRWQDRDLGTCNFTPFGGGQRLCPGLDLARLETSIFLHHLVTQFRWIAEDDSVVNFPTVRLKKKMPIWVNRRRRYMRW